MGPDGLQSAAELGVPYSMVLYERFLGRPFAGHRDSISELVGNVVENAIEDVLSRTGISFRKTKRAERLPGFDQAPDFIIPNEFNPQVVIEAKLTEDDGTARDKVTRVQHLGSLSTVGQPPDRPKFEVIACIAGRGFGVRREDMRKLLLATRGKGFHIAKYGLACATYASRRVPFSVAGVGPFVSSSSNIFVFSCPDQRDLRDDLAAFKNAYREPEGSIETRHLKLYAGYLQDFKKEHERLVMKKMIRVTTLTGTKDDFRY